MSPEVACAMLHMLATFNLEIGQLRPVPLVVEGPSLDQLTDQEQRVIVSLLTELLGRPPTDTEIQMATAG